MPVSRINFSKFRLPAAFDPAWNCRITISLPIDVTNRSSDRTLDFSRIPPDGSRSFELLFWIAHAFEQWAAGKQPSTIQERYKAIGPFFHFLVEFYPSVHSPAQLSATVFDDFHLWISQRTDISLEMRRRIWGVPNQLLTLLRNCRPDLVPSELPSQRYSEGRNPHKMRSVAKSVLTKLELGDILRACRSRITEYRTLLSNAHAEMEAAIAAGYDASVRPHRFTKGEIFLWLRKHYIKGTSDEAIKAISYLAFATDRRSIHGLSSPREAYRPVVLDHMDLLPYFILIGAYTGANTTSLLDFDIDCLSTPDSCSRTERDFVNALNGTRDYVTWGKRRSGFSQHRSFPTNQDFLPPRLISEVIDLTKTLRPLVDKRFRNKLFISDVLRRGPLWWHQTALTDKLKTFRHDNKLPYFTLRSLRDALINYGFLATNGNVLAVQRLANHRSTDTTQNIYLSSIAHQRNDCTLSSLSRRLVKWLNEGSSGRDDLRESVAPQTMSLTDAWLALLENPTTILVSTTFRTAHILHLRDHLIRARAELHPLRWMAICGPVLDAIEKHLIPSLPRETLLDAEKMRIDFPPLPPLQ